MMTEAEAMKVIDAFYERHPEQWERPVEKVAEFIRQLPDDERQPLDAATSTLTKAALRWQQTTRCRLNSPAEG